MNSQDFQALVPILGLALLVGLAGVFGWIFTTWLRIKNGYPLENSWGKAMHPQVDRQSQERITLLTQENAQLRAELGSIKDRLVTVERIVTDGAFRLDQEFARLDRPAN
ncbi:hypothetical protein [Sphingomonas sp. ID0503]|uniref:hypothetical protein n=1 Tax=Sphingomonas sp. ID0503 TaxID=3399691 RepID=UPI003AFA0978